MTIKPIETRYKGYRFRSRLEARWAVFFDTAGINWEYEPEGFELPSGRYLPDFYVWGNDYHQGCYLEVKPHRDVITERQKQFREELDSYLVEIYDYARRCTFVIGVPVPMESGDHTTAWLHGCYSSQNANLDKAIAAARSARFEHGEAP